MASNWLRAHLSEFLLKAVVRASEFDFWENGSGQDLNVRTSRRIGRVKCNFLSLKISSFCFLILFLIVLGFKDLEYRDGKVR